MPKLVPQTKLTKMCSHAIEAFHRALGGRTFKHEYKGKGGNVTCPIISKDAIGLRPSHTTPQFQQTSMNSSTHCLTNFAKYKQLEQKNESMES